MTSYTKEEIEKIIEENRMLKEKVEKKRLQKVKLKNDLEIANMLYIDDIREQIDDSIYKGINQITINCGKNFYKEHKLNYIKEYVIKELTTYTNGDSQYSSFRNGYYYLNGDCMSPYEVEYNDDGTFCFNRVETESEEEEDTE